MVAIKGFEMPKYCDCCPFYTYHDDFEDDCGITGDELFHVKHGERHENCPLVDIEPVKTGHWINLNENNDGHCDDFGEPYVKCSECGEHNGTNRSAYCPECGAMMVVE